MKDKSFIEQLVFNVAIVFIALILVDSTQFEIKLEKKQFSVLNSVINVVGYGKAMVKVAKEVL